MEKNWYSLDISTTNREKQKHVNDLKRRINTLFTNPNSWDEIMIFSPKKEGIKFSPIWIIPPKTVALLPKETLTFSGAEKCHEPDINEVSITIGEEQNIHYFFDNQ